MSCTICITFSWDINADAQNRLFFVPDPTTAHWSYHETAPDGTLVATMFHSVDTMTGDAVNGSVKLKITRVGIQSPADTLNSFMYYKFKDGECMVDMNAFFEGDALSSLMNAAAENEGREGSEDEKKKAIDDVKREMIVIASMMAGKVVNASIDTAVRDSLIDETLKEIGESTWLS